MALEMEGAPCTEPSPLPPPYVPPYWVTSPLRLTQKP
jgi:hypothetical protein